MQRLLIVLCTAVGMMFTASSAANAQFYVGLHGGANFVQDNDLDNDGGVSAQAELDPGFVVGGVAGYRVGIRDGLSVDLEGEFSYRLNDIDKISAAGFSTAAGGEVQSFLWMANAWLNWEIDGSGFVPYIGGGFGGVHIDMNDAQAAGINLDSQSDFVIGGQLGGGLGYQIGAHLVVSLNYRFLITEDAQFETFDVEYQNHAVMLGIKYLF